MTNPLVRSIIDTIMPRILILLLLFGSTACAATPAPAPPTQRPQLDLSPNVRKVIASAHEQTSVTTSYDPAYVKLAYPGGDVPASTGVCTDVVIRSFRAAGVDLQREVHEDMARSFSAYPRKWGLSRPDSNIDHRRVPNLMKYFERRGKSLGVTSDAADYRPGDVVAWDLGGGVTHIGVVSDEADPASGRFWIVHNIGAGARHEDVLFGWTVIGHYRYFE